MPAIHFDSVFNFTLIFEYSSLDLLSDIAHRLPAHGSWACSHGRDAYLKVRYGPKLLNCFPAKQKRPVLIYEIIRTGPSPIHPLSEYLANKFSNYNWTDLEKANQVHENVLPKFGLVKVLMEGVNILVIITIVKALLDGSLWSPVQQKLIQENPFLLGALTYIILFGLISLIAFWKRRVRLQRAGNVLKYLTILYPTERRCNNDAGQL